MVFIRNGLERSLEAVLIVLMATLAVLVVLAVVLRAMRSPLTWYDEVAGVMLAWITFYGAALAALKRAHLGFPNLVASLPPPVRVPITLATSLLVIGFFLITAWYGWQVVQQLQGDYLTSLPWVSISFAQSVVPIGAVLFVLAELLVLPDRLREAAAGAPPRAEHEEALRDEATPAGDNREQARP
jgi:TRAP-type C4-dicarboxylate transport system permease small subunit